MIKFSESLPPFLNKREQLIVNKYEGQYPFSIKEVRDVYNMCNRKAIILRQVLKMALKTGRNPTDIIQINFLK